MRWLILAASTVIFLAMARWWFMAGPRSFHAQFERDAAEGLVRLTASDIVTDTDLAPLPAPVQRYLRLVGVVGQPRVQNYRLSGPSCCPATARRGGCCPRASSSMASSTSRT